MKYHLSLSIWENSIISVTTLFTSSFNKTWQSPLLVNYILCRWFIGNLCDAYLVILIHKRPISSNFFAGWTEEKWESAANIISPLPTQGAANSLSVIVTYLSYSAGEFPSAAVAASYTALPFTNFNFIITMILPKQLSWILQPESDLQSICT